MKPNPISLYVMKNCPTHLDQLWSLIMIWANYAIYEPPAGAKKKKAATIILGRVLQCCLPMSKSFSAASLASSAAFSSASLRAFLQEWEQK